jgi:hypothetical protein
VRTQSYRVAGTRVAVTAPERIGGVLEQMLVRLSFAEARAPELVVVVRPTAISWSVTIAGEPRCRLNVGRNALPPQVAGTIVSAILSAVALREGAHALRGAVLARDHRALALRGRDWRELFVLTAHLCARGWSIVAGSATFVNADGHVRPLHKLLYCDANALERVPRAFRGALETSPWFVGDRELFYYAIDPANVAGTRAWSSGERLAGLLDVGDVMAADAAIVAPAGHTPHPQAILTPGTTIGTVDAIERWWDESVLAATG